MGSIMTTETIQTAWLCCNITYRSALLFSLEPWFWSLYLFTFWQRKNKTASSLKWFRKRLQDKNRKLWFKFSLFLFYIYSSRCCMAASLVFRLHDRGPEVLREVLLERGWEEYVKEERQEEDWNLYWRGSAFRNSEYHNLLPWQRLNHHPKTVGVTRKVTVWHAVLTL